MRTTCLALACAAFVAGPAPAQTDAANALRTRLPQDEIVYFLLPDRFENGDPSNDRGGLKGGRLVTGFDPADEGFYHGGDLKGLIGRLGYIQDLGATAIWVAPIFKNKACAGTARRGIGRLSRILDYRFYPGRSAFRQQCGLQGARRCGSWTRNEGLYGHRRQPYCRRHRLSRMFRLFLPRSRRFSIFAPRGSDRCAINQEFAGDAQRTTENFAKLTDPSFAYTPYLPRGQEHAKQPEWLNDITLYHNRGNSSFTGESATLGDFFGLDDLMTEHPRVLQGMIEIFGDWIDRYGVDGFRIDTERHVEPEFWQAFVPAMLARAKARGIPNFHIFGEVALETLDVGQLARHTVVDGMPAVLDFPFRQAVLESVAGTRGTDVWETLFDGDALYAHGADTAAILPTFISNHDTGRLSTYIRKARPSASDAEVLQRMELAYAMLLTLRGVPTIYAGDEQGFVSDGGDRDAREDMFASRVASYNDNRLLGTAKTTATAHFQEENPLFRHIAALARLRRAYPALSRGKQTLRAREDKPGLLAVSRFDPATGGEILIAFNTSDEKIQRQVEVDTASRRFSTIAGSGCAAAASAPGSLTLSLPPLGFAVCAAGVAQ